AVHHLEAHSYRSVYIGLFPHGVRSRGLAEPARWLREVERFVGTAELLGVDPDRYPADFAALVRYGSALRHLPEVPGPDPGSLALADALPFLPVTDGKPG